MRSERAPPLPTPGDADRPPADRLGRSAWAVIPTEASGGEDLQCRMTGIADGLGSRVGGRGGDLIEVVAPREAGAAHPRSLSAAHGLGRLPLHVELSHRLRPCRYVLLGCLDAGAAPAATTLLDRRDLLLAPDEGPSFGARPC